MHPIYIQATNLFYSTVFYNCVTQTTSVDFLVTNTTESKKRHNNTFYHLYDSVFKDRWGIYIFSIILITSTASKAPARCMQWIHNLAFPLLNAAKMKHCPLTRLGCPNVLRHLRLRERKTSSGYLTKLNCLSRLLLLVTKTTETKLVDCVQVKRVYRRCWSSYQESISGNKLQVQAGDSWERDPSSVYSPNENRVECDSQELPPCCVWLRVSQEN